MKNIFKILAFIPLLTACDDMFQPSIENNRDLDAMYGEPSYAQGVLANAYILLPYSSSPGTDLASDDAVTNDNSSSWITMATGSWKSESDPTSQWQNRYNAIQYINLFLEKVDNVEWARDEKIKTMFRDRLKGEAYGLRALNMYYLLRAHAGKVNGELYGVPIKLNSESSNSDFNQPRDTFEDCVAQIIDDCEQAIELLPLDYTEHSVIPQKYQEIGVSNVSDYNRVNGAHMGGRITGRIVEAIKAQVTLMAASPAFNLTGSSDLWKEAANSAATVLDRIGGVSGLDMDGNTWYANTTEINNLAAGANPAEILWRGNVSQSNSLETSNFPPSLYGNGLVNPTQNLVDAFPMANGYPITDTENSNYDEANPYENRDPRLSLYVVLDGSTQGPDNSVITTGVYGTNNDALNKESGYSTRTGYYLRKLLRKDCNPNPQYNTTQKHYTAYIRYTEIFLAYAEAANEAWGPTGTGDNTYSAYDVIKAIRTRAGVGTDNGDAYLESIKNDQDKMRELIRNERRLELCFENFRFYDIRRWNSDLTESAEGVSISSSNGVLKYTPIHVEKRAYESYMNYGPIPYSEILKFDQLKQNDGWK